MASQKPKTAREKAAEARAQAEAADKRRRMLINVSIGAVLLIVVVALVGGAFLSRQSSQNALQPNADAAVPTGGFPSGTEFAYGIPFSDGGADKPVLEIWEDFQCPACRDFEAAFGPTVKQIADNNQAQVIFRSTSFLDANFPGDNSKRAAAAFGCAVDAGKGQEYKTLVYANQPANEGDGWTDDQLIAFGEEAGISGDAKSTFDQCVRDKTYITWAVNGTDTMKQNGVPGTPGIYLNGQELPDAARANPQAFQQAVLEAGKSAQTQ